MALLSIVHRMDLCLELIDATTGQGINDSRVTFHSDGKLFPMTRKQNGNYILINSQRLNRQIQVDVYGYEPITVDVNYEELDEMRPIKQVLLIPKVTESTFTSLWSIEGELPGIQDISAVVPSSASFSYQSYDRARKMVKILNPHNLELIGKDYGLIHTDEASFEAVEAIELKVQTKLMLADLLEEEFEVTNPIARIVFGHVDENGKYLLRVRATSTENKNVILCYHVDGKRRYQVLDFTNARKLQLERRDE
ncbi:hypothetical protein [Pseudobutyrivibrio sp. MD2005]|uniref:hypothetical protein n=1 Tax=Pseudobutyrivibrio sp. MD2005 TaxID=1410616 RepID=UPI000481344E|nr:hypothetical protein [Pseudobutyrivibrio sp. MD2005]